ncbi:hypothetical protein DFH08DRAFT_513468 [Mycena albidolilacea]|uniref:F-box domain-containing protein n=1 Tax=Mycena albidolilacea TaxID=1033008 RepID=A0AAD7EAM2_9AGAR|nr:hypothetical protein DFH08DRAFT_513468 [Mycena albidolilacea]
MLNSLETDRFHLADIEGRIRDLERLLSSLRIEHALVQERLDAYKYPVITLPSEMVSEIFIHCLPIYPHPPPLIGVDSPTLLAQICRKWRDIALSTPALWRAIQLTSDSTTFLGMCKQGRISEVWMRRSASCPLSINIDSHRSLSWSELSAAVIAHRPRWEHLELTVPTSALLTIVGPMPFLWRLDLGLVPMETIHTIPPIQEVPHLRTVSLRGWIASRVTLPWQKLTSLTLFMADPSQCVTILRQTSNLIHCHLHLDEELEPFIDPGLDIPLPRLESLVLKNHSCVSLTGFLDSFVVPALYSLTMEEEFLGADRILSLKSFISKSGCKLEEVRITLEGATRGKSYLSAFPSIPNFSFIGRYAWNDDDSDFSSD